MQIHNIFYGLGSIFILAAISYVAWEYLLVLSKEVKTIILFLMSLIFFLVGRYFQGRGI
jgi:hypothetical protein